MAIGYQCEKCKDLGYILQEDEKGYTVAKPCEWKKTDIGKVKEMRLNRFFQEKDIFFFWNRYRISKTGKITSYALL